MGTVANKFKPSIEKTHKFLNLWVRFSQVMRLPTGIFGMVRNPLAHNAKIKWDMCEQDALDTLTMLSLVHRKLDSAQALAED